MRHLRSLLFALCLLPLPAIAAPKPGMGIAAVVGQDAISSYDVSGRMAFIIATAKLSDTPEVHERVRPQILRTLIDEKLEMQEAAKNGITVSEQEVAAAIAEIEKERGMSPGAVHAMMQQRNIPKDTFNQQIRAQLAWRKLVLKKIRPGVRVSEEEVKLARQSGAGAALPQEMQIAVLTLPIDSPKREAEVRRLSEKLSGEIRGGASFEEVSRQLAGVASSRTGKAEMFWVKLSQMEPSMARLLATAKAGTITPPLRTPDGYAIIKVYDVRANEPEAASDSEVEVKDILLKLKAGAPEAESDALFSIAGEVAKNPGKCQEKTIAGIDDLKAADIEVNIQRGKTSLLPAGIRSIVEGLKPGEISTPFASDSGIRLYMLCERKDVSADQRDDERARNQLFFQKIELEAQKYLRNLRNETFIEIR